MTASPRAALARERFDRLIAARPETRHQALDDWLQIATGGEVRRHWPRVMREASLRGLRAAIPPWAAR
jgi:hypothetical protein